MKHILFVITALIALILLPAEAIAAETADNDMSDIISLIDEQYDASGADRLEDALPEEISYELRRIGMDIPSIYSDGIDNQKLIDKIIQSFSDSTRAPVKVFAASLAIIVIYSLAKGVSGDKAISCERSMSAAASAAVCCILITPAGLHIEDCARSLKIICRFIETAIPIISAVTASGGEPLRAGCFSGTMIAATEMAAIVVDGYLIELLRSLLALACVAPISSVLKLGKLIEFAESSFKWVMSLVSTIYIGVLSVSCSLACAADSASAKAAKLIISGSVPVIGGVVGDAVGTVRGCIGILRSSIGAFGLAAVCLVLIPPLVKTILWNLSAEICAALADMLGAREIAELLRSAAGVMKLLLSVIVFIGVVVLGSLGIAAGGRAV